LGIGLLGAFRRLPIVLADLLNMILHRALIARGPGLIRKPAGHPRCSTNRVARTKFPSPELGSSSVTSSRRRPTLGPTLPSASWEERHLKFFRQKSAADFGKLGWLSLRHHPQHLLTAPLPFGSHIGHECFTKLIACTDWATPWIARSPRLPRPICRISSCELVYLRCYDEDATSGRLRRHHYPFRHTSDNS
jgi:hypothetical protein